MHGHHLNYDLPAQFSVPERVDDFSLNLFLAWLDECTVCLGYPDEYFVNMLESRGDTARHNDAIVSILDNYAPITWKNISKTVRSSCRLVYNGTTKCDQCVSYRDSLQKSYYR